jgi:hypothetical protein
MNLLIGCKEEETLVLFAGPVFVASIESGLLCRMSVSTFRTNALLPPETNSPRQWKQQVPPKRRDTLS